MSQPPDHSHHDEPAYPPIEQPSVSADRLRITIPAPMLWSFIAAIIIATFWAANQWMGVQGELKSMNARMERMEAYITRNSWTRQAMQVWSYEASRRNPTFTAPNVPEIWDTTQGQLPPK